jgi:thioredoxin-related protein
LYEKYKKYGFTVFAVSFDPFMDRFTNAVNLDKLWWNNVNDTLGTKSPLLSEYQISGFPAFVLIDGKGKIIERFLSDKALSIWLEENLAKADAK